MKDLRRTAQGNHDQDTSEEGGGGGPKAVRVKLLGGFSVSVGVRIIEEGEWRLRKAAALVKLLALAPGHRLHREQIMALLWPNLDSKAASNNLRYILHVTRRALGATPASKASHFLHLRGKQILLCPSSPLWVDVDAFEEASATARRLRKPSAYRAAIELYAGELLPGDLYEGWAEERREELRRTYLALLVELAGLYEERKEFGPAIEALVRVVAAEPTHEEAHVELMRLYALSGQRGRALEQYELLREALSRELGRQPKATSQHLREGIVAGRFPTARSSSEGSPPEEPPKGRRHNLPAPRTSFVGRKRERVEVKRILTTTRLLTLTGTGGSGKTRLALEVARDLVDVYPDGVWLVELAGLSEGGLVPQAVAEVLKVRERPGRSLTEALVEALRTKEMLLVLDNCEHVIDAAARLADTLLDGCPRLRILATSREALEVAGEVNWRVPSLSVPEHRQPPTVESVAHFESAQLFVERARYRRSAFMVTPQDILAVVEICQQLDGIPLAMELSAALVGVLSVKQIAARLGNSLELLTAGGRTAAPRHQTLRGTLQWSFELLSEQERKLFGRLSVFMGGWTLDAAEAVGAGEDIRREEVMGLLSRLVDKSLVVTEADKGGGLCYRMLEPVRQYARQKLEESGEADAVMRRHAAFFLAMAEEAEPGLMGAQQRASWMERVEIEHDNFRAALSWTLERGEAELGLRLVGALGGFWQIRGYLIEGWRWLEAALASEEDAPPSARLKVLIWLGAYAWEQLDHERATASYREALPLARELDDKARLAAALHGLGMVEMYLRVELKRAWELFEESLALYRELGDTAGIALTLHAMGLVATTRSWQDYERAQALYEESLALARKTENKQVITLSLSQGALVALERGNRERVKALCEESLKVARQIEYKHTIVFNLHILAATAGSEGQLVRSARLWGAAAALGQSIGLPGLAPVELHQYGPYIDVARARLGEEEWEAAWAEGKAMSEEEAIEYALSKEEPAPPTTPAPSHEEQLIGKQRASLTRREREVAVLVARGLTNRQIAKELVISENTVDRHVAKVLRKLGFGSRAQIAAWVTERQLLPPDSS